MKLIPTAIILVMVLILAGCSRPSADNNRTAGTIVEGGESAQDEGEGSPEPTRAVTASTTILADGLLAVANPVLSLSFETSGRLQDILPEAGDGVGAGDLVAAVDDSELQAAVINAELALSQADAALAQAQLSLDKLVNWEPDEMAVAVAEANLAAAEARLESALSQDAAAGDSITAARISLGQAQRALNDIQEAYDNAWDEARDWELNYNETICYPGQGGLVPCTGPTWKARIENERDSTERGLIQAKDALTVAQANYNLALAGVSANSGLEGELAVLNAQQALNQAQTGPDEAEIQAAELQVTQAELSLQSAQNALDQARTSLDKAKLYAPWAGTVVSVDAALGSLVGPGTPIITLMDTEELQFQTTNLSERDLPHIAPGQKAEISFKSYPNQKISGSVDYINPVASGQVGDAATFTVVIALDENDLDLWPGMLGRADILREED